MSPKLLKKQAARAEREARKAMEALKTVESLIATFVSQQAGKAKHFGMTGYKMTDDVAVHLQEAALELSKSKHSESMHRDLVKLKSRHEHALAQKYKFDIEALYKPNYQALVATFTQDEQIVLGYMDWLVPQLDPKFKGANGYESPFKALPGGGMVINMANMTADQKKQVMAMI